VVGKNFLLILDDRLLVPQNLELIAEQKSQPNLVIQELFLIPDDHRLVRDDFSLVAQSGLRHCPSLLLARSKRSVVPSVNDARRGRARARS
jgi:hypothetical protein